MSHRKVRALWLGRQPYEPVHLLQQEMMEARKQGQIGDTLLLLEHDPVITMGRGAKPEHLLVSKEDLAQRGVELVATGRGGDFTYHGPGQLVGYPIIDLAPDRCDVRKYVKNLLSTMILLAADHGIAAGTIDEHVGVWIDRKTPEAWPGQQNVVDAAKIGAVGVRISRWITMHGFAFNTRTDLDAFSLIVPCGIRDLGVTSLHRLIENAPLPEQLAQAAAKHLCDVMRAELDCFEMASLQTVMKAAAIG